MTITDEEEARRILLIRRGYAIPAAHPGRCARCYETIRPGDPIRSEDTPHHGRIWLGPCCIEMP